MNTTEIMDLALSMVGIEEIPADSQIYHHGENIRKVLFGIDIGVAELSIAKQMGYDAVIAHHPTGAIRTFYSIIDEHARQLMESGVPEETAWKAIESLKEQRELWGIITNTEHVPSFARLIDMPFLNIHYPLDQIGRKILQRVVSGLPEESTVGEMVDKLGALPELSRSDVPIQVKAGSAENKLGKVAVSHGAGTNGGFEIARAYFDHGIDTLVYIHVHYPELKKIREYKEHGNLVCTGHITSDLIGINPFISELEKAGIEVTRVSGLEQM